MTTRAWATPTSKTATEVIVVIERRICVIIVSWVFGETSRRKKKRTALLYKYKKILLTPLPEGR